MDVIGNEGDHFGPIELATNVLDRLSDARVAHEAVIMARRAGHPIGWLVSGHIQLTLVAKKSPSCERDHGSGSEQ